MLNIEEGNLFMMCEKLNPQAFAELPDGFHFRLCRKEELKLWKMIHFDAEPENFLHFMDENFEKVYRVDEEKFWNSCLFVCDSNDRPVGTCFAWKVYGQVTTIHWYKVKKEYEGYGIGRALLSKVMREIAEEEFPVFLHSHPACVRAIKLYTDFGFSLLTDGKIGYRENHLQEALPYLKRRMPSEVYEHLKFSTAPDYFLQAIMTDEYNQF